MTELCTQLQSKCSTANFVTNGWCYSRPAVEPFMSMSALIYGTITHASCYIWY